MPAAKQPASIHQLKVTLRDTKPPIWRRVQVSSNSSLEDLHYVLQVAIGWENAHLHQFEVDGEHFSDPEFGLEETRSERSAKLSRVAPAPKTRFEYEYDFGDSWEHEIVVEKIQPPEPGVRYPICLAGKRAGPPEDCGGVWGYEELLEILRDPDHPEYGERLEWLGGEFDPEEFDLETINAALAGLR